uniref:AlNc14C476G11860 protein n=1 Tax=Albugo laibachii Nc14 TaxID=890382 RepID=F0X0C2_9STRA|nr:AlNc14C476G11860 [Albugo laibachii Nc14]|eukprot:CCA27206.1 AlNc14C476G11860 [Albugo laibachii Nc14]
MWAIDFLGMKRYADTNAQQSGVMMLLIVVFVSLDDGLSNNSYTINGIPSNTFSLQVNFVPCSKIIDLSEYSKSVTDNFIKILRGLAYQPSRIEKEHLLVYVK